MTLAKISTVVGLLTVFLGGLSTTVVYIYNYHQTLSTNKDNTSMYIDLRLNDIDDWIFYYNQKDGLSVSEQRQLDRLLKTQERLDAQRSKVMGFTGD